MDTPRSVAVLRQFASVALGGEVAYEKVSAAPLVVQAVRGAGESNEEQRELVEAIEGLLGFDGDGKKAFVDSEGKIAQL